MRRSSVRTRIRSRTTSACTRRRTSEPAKPRAIRSSVAAEYLLAEGLATREELDALHAEVEREVNVATDIALAAEKPAARHGSPLRLLARRRRHRRHVADRSARRRQARHDGRGDQPHAARRDGRQSAHRRLRRGRGGREPGAGARRVSRQGRRVQGHAWPAAGVRWPARLQLSAGRGQHRRARHRHGDARAQARRRDPVLRLHLAGVHADS